MITYNHQKPGIVRRLAQTGKTSVPVDRTLKAIPPGKRVSATGHVYWETRKNRSDINPKTRL
jgi:hypothetical protein